MSGFEVVGVVLGSIPLIISGLEHYRKAIGIIKRIRDYALVFDRILTTFRISLMIYMASCKQLLGPMCLTDQEEKALFLDGKGWDNHELLSKVEDHWGSKHEDYIDMVKLVNWKLQTFCKHLRMTNEFMPPWLNDDGSIDQEARKKFFKKKWIRIQGGFEAEKYDSLIVDIDRNIQKLMWLTDSARQLKPLQSKRRLPPSWKTVRDQAQMLFDSFHSRLNSCSCRCSHQANLRLRSHGVFDDEDSTIRRFAFVLTFDEAGVEEQDLPWKRRHIEVESVQMVHNMLHKPAILSSSAAIPTGQRGVSFGPSIVLPIIQPPQIPDPVSSIDSPRIENLCTILLNDRSSISCLGFLENHLNHQPWLHQLFFMPDSLTRRSVTEAVSLRHAISNSRTGLTSKGKYSAALALAAAVLQLHDTPWLSGRWSIEEIALLESNNMSPEYYLSRTFDKASCTPQRRGKSRCIRNEAVFALGVALLELSYAEALADLCIAEDLNEDGERDAMTNINIATRLAETIHERESDNYADAVNRCVFFKFDARASQLHDQELQEKFFEGVVEPLMSDYKSAFRHRQL